MPAILSFSFPHRGRDAAARVPGEDSSPGFFPRLPPRIPPRGSSPGFPPRILPRGSSPGLYHPAPAPSHSGPLSKAPPFLSPSRFPARAVTPGCNAGFSCPTASRPWGGNRPRRTQCRRPAVSKPPGPGGKTLTLCDNFRLSLFPRPFSPFFLSVWE